MAMMPNVLPQPTAEAGREAARNVLEARDFSLAYGEKTALRNITLSVREREILAIIGPSGCGKSTFLRSLNRMNDRIQGVKMTGELLFEGTSLLSPQLDPVWLRRRVGMVFQKPTPFPMSIFDNVAYGPRLHRLGSRADIAERVERSLRDAALWDEVKDRLHAPATGLSGGQQQRLCIARTLAVEPEVILLDEPTSALDPAATARIEDLVAELAERYTLVLVTHNMQQAARVSHRTAFFLNGELVEAATTSELFHRPRDKRTEDYITGRFG